MGRSPSMAGHTVTPTHQTATCIPSSSSPRAAHHCRRLSREVSAENGAWTRPPPGSRIATLTFPVNNKKTSAKIIETINRKVPTRLQDNTHTVRACVLQLLNARIVVRSLCAQHNQMPPQQAPFHNNQAPLVLEGDRVCHERVGPGLEA